MAYRELLVEPTIMLFCQSRTELVSYLWYILATVMPLTAQEWKTEAQSANDSLLDSPSRISSSSGCWFDLFGGLERTGGFLQGRRSTTSRLLSHPALDSTAFSRDQPYLPSEWNLVRKLVLWRVRISVFCVCFVLELDQVMLFSCSVLIPAQRPSNDRHLSQNLDVLSQRAQKVTIL